MAPHVIKSLVVFITIFVCIPICFGASSDALDTDKRFDTHDNPALLPDSDADLERKECTTDIARDGTPCRCNHSCGYHGWFQTSKWCYINYQGGSKYCCHGPCERTYIQDVGYVGYCVAGAYITSASVECHDMVDRE